MWLSNAVNKSKICRQSSEQKQAKIRQKAKKCQISDPHISPKWGRILPPNKTIFLTVARAIRGNGQIGGAGPKPKNAPNPKFEPTLLEFHEFNFQEIFSIVRAPMWLSNAVKNWKICRQSSEQT